MTDGLRIEGLSVRHDGRPVLTDISLAVAPGESLCLVGASGGGKSLIATAIFGLLPGCMAASGRIRLGDVSCPAADNARLRALWHRESCLLPQEPLAALAPLLRAGRQVALTPPRLGRAEARRWLERFGLDRNAAGRLPSELSGGMGQRLLAALVARSPAPVLVVDEPTKGLDTVRRAELVAILASLRDAGRSLLVVTHDLDIVAALGGRLAVLEDGRIAEQGSAALLLQAPQSAFLRACRSAAAGRSHPAPAAGRAVATADGLVVARGRHILAGPVDFGLAEGRVTTLLGPSGAGKTTLGDTLLGLAPPAGGRVTWFGAALDQKRRQTLRPRFQKLHQDPTTVFPAGRRFGDSLADLRRLPDGRAATTRLAELMERLRVSPTLLQRFPGEVSGGEAQRLALARVLALRPALLVADEPCSRLDRPVQAATMQLLRDLSDDGLAVLLISHDLPFTETISDATVAL